MSRREEKRKQQREHQHSWSEVKGAFKAFLAYEEPPLSSYFDDG